ncbi:hypothetical protein PQX77_020238 [Marasmius sp. AFHP31]|nr:hypothetical protein PQX77_020238 [Marasmius sp. AFHP31]
MSQLVTPAFLDRLQSLYPSESSDKGTSFSVSSSFVIYLTVTRLYALHPVWKNPWYIIATVAFNASNEPEAIPLVFQHALKSASNHDERLLLARKMRDAIYKGAVNSGFAKGINSLVALDKVMPDELKDKEMIRKPTAQTIPEYEAAGQKFFQTLYGETADSVQTILDTIYHDLGWFSNTIAYGMIYGFTEILTPVETSYTLIGTLIASDTPRQINWHLKGARRFGASVEEVKAARQIAMEVSELCGVRWKDGVPELQE